MMIEEEKKEKLSTEQLKLIELIEDLSPYYAKALMKDFLKKNSIRTNKEKKQVKFLQQRKVKQIKLKKPHINIQFLPQMIIQAMLKGIPLHEPKRKKSSKPELSPLIYQTIEASNLSKKFSEKDSSFFDENLKAINYIPDKIYLQRLDSDNSKMLVKMLVDWGYLQQDLLHLFLTPENHEKAICRIAVFNEDNILHGFFPLRHASLFQDDNEGTSRALFVGLITELLPSKKYKYRIECYDKSSKKQFVETSFKEFRTSFNINQVNKQFFITVSSDLHGGRNSNFMRGKVQRKKITGNLELAKLFNEIALTENAATFGEGYSLAIATGDLTENASYSEYWVDLFTRCSILWNHVPLISCIGNHDYYCGGLRRGNMLGGLEEDCRYWHRFITSPNSSAGNVPEHWFSIDQGNIHAIFLDTNGLGWGKYSIECGSEQWLWLEQDLKNWRERVARDKHAPQYCFVFLHSAIMSLGFWGRGFNNGNDEKVQSYLTSLFRRYGVNMVFCGHDHIYQRSEWMGTIYLQNGRHGGTTRPYFFWKKRKTIYNVENICENWNTRIYTTLYVPPNNKQMNSHEREDFEQFKTNIRRELLFQPTASNYFFGIRKINQLIGKLIDENKRAKEKLIDEFIMTKLDNHLWFRSYGVEKDYPVGKREIIDMFFQQPSQPHSVPNEIIPPYICPEKVVK